MKRFALLVLFLLALAAPVMGQPTGDLSVYMDDQGSTCNITAGPSQTIFPYLILKFGGGGESTGCRFKLTVPAGWAIFGFNTPFVPVGNIATDISLAYGVCINTPTVLGQLILGAPAAPVACSYISVVAADNFPEPFGTNCNFAELPMGNGQGIVNPDITCPCSIAVEETSWGRVKSLYR